MTDSNTEADRELRTNLDEIALRSRAGARRAAEVALFWPETGSHKSFMAEQRVLGNRLRRELLPEVLGDEDAAAVGASSVGIFGKNGPRLRARLPLVMAGGYEFGAGLCALIGGAPERATESGRLCAVFNLCGALYDTIYDDYASLFEQASKGFNEPVLRAVLEDEFIASRELERQARDAEAIEVRLLLKSLSWSLSRVRRLLHSEAGKKSSLSTTIIQALRAELQSATVRASSEHELLEASRAKFLLPFHVVREVVLLTAAPDDQKVVPLLDKLISAVGNSLWLIDDLTDVARDLQTGALNSLLVRAGGTPSRHPDKAESRAVAARLLKTDYIERAGDEVHTNIVEAMETLQSKAFPAGPAARMLMAFSAYTRNSLE